MISAGFTRMFRGSCIGCRLRFEGFQISDRQTEQKRVWRSIEENYSCFNICDKVKDIIFKSQLLYTIHGDAAENGDSGFLLLREILLDGEVRKLRFPIPLVLNIAENGFVQLANTEYAILV